MKLFRTCLFVPADSARKLAKARTLRPDAFIYDLEDAVAPDKKLEARQLLIAELREMPPTPVTVFVRVNPASTPFFEDDLRMAVRPGVYGLVVPKVNTAAEMRHADDAIRALEREAGLPEGGMKILPILESAKGILNAAEIAVSSARLEALNFGGEDYCADMGISRTKPGDEIAFARFMVSLAAKSAGLEALDGVFTDFNDPDGLFQETLRMKQFGFTGKTLIHPNQIDTVHRALAASEEEIAWAQEVVSTFERAGAGVAVVRGKMVDEPVVLQARRILRQRDVPAANH